MRHTKEVWAKAHHNNLFIVSEVLCYKLDQLLLLLNQISSLSGSKTSMISKFQHRRKQNQSQTHSGLQRPFLMDYLNKIKYKLNLINSKHLSPLFFSNLQPFNNNSSLSKLPLLNFLQLQRSLLNSTSNNSHSSNPSRQPPSHLNAQSPLPFLHRLQ